MKSSGIVVSALFVASLVIGGCGSGDETNPGADESSSDQDLTSATQCKGMLPKNCQVCSGGATSCAHWAISNKKCVIEVCAPAAITSPAQCTGFLPHNCRVCDDGKTACAHWAVKDGACAIETCAAPPPECITANDCTGFLPATAQVCTDGTTHRASHVCTAGKCGIQICPK